MWGHSVRVTGILSEWAPRRHSTSRKPFARCVYNDRDW